MKEANKREEEEACKSGGTEIGRMEEANKGEREVVCKNRY